MFRPKKGEYGYIRARKYTQLLLAILMGIIGLSIYFAGYVVNDYKQIDICLVLGILMALPGAKFLVTYILLFPYKTPNRELYLEMKDRAPKEGLFLSDLVITSTENAMNLDFLYIGNGCVYGLSGKNKKGITGIQEYLSKGVRNWGTSYTVKITDRADSFKKSLNGIVKKETNAEEEKRVSDYIYSLIV